MSELGVWMDGWIDGCKQTCLAHLGSEYQAGNLPAEQLEEESQTTDPCLNFPIESYTLLLSEKSVLQALPLPLSKLSRPLSRK